SSKTLIALVHEGDGPCRLVAKCEGVLSAPWSSALATIVLGQKHLVGGAECLDELVPLAGARARAMQGYDPAASHYRTCMHTVFFIVLHALTCSCSGAGEGHTEASRVASHGGRNLGAMQPNILELTVAKL